MSANDNPRILVVDIETKLFRALLFGLRDQHVAHTQVEDDYGGRLIHMVGLKWLGERKTTVLTEWDHGNAGMLQGIHDALSEADAVVGYNSIAFDIPRLDGQFALAGMPYPPSPTHIDLYKTVRKMGFISSKLDYVAPLFGLGGKLKHDGMAMWKAVAAGCPKARAKMTRYCGQDVRLTEELYHKLRPYIRNHPHLHNTPPRHCGACGSGHVHVSKYRRTKTMKIQQLHCQTCGGYFDGKRTAA